MTVCNVKRVTHTIEHTEHCYLTQALRSISASFSSLFWFFLRPAALMFLKSHRCHNIILSHRKQPLYTHWALHTSEHTGHLAATYFSTGVKTKLELDGERMLDIGQVDTKTRLPVSDTVAL